MIDDVAVIMEDQPLWEDVVGNYHDHVIDNLNDQLLNRRVKLQQADPNVHDDHVHDQGQAPVEVEPEEFLEEGFHGWVVGAKDPDLIGEVGNEHRQEPGNHVGQLVVPMHSGTEKLEYPNVHDGGDDAPEQVGNDRTVLVEEGPELTH